MKPLIAVLALLAGLAIACSSAGTVSNNNEAASAGSVVSAPDVAPPSPANTDSATRVVVTTSIALEVADPRSTYEAVGDTTRRFGGYVAEGRLASDYKLSSNDKQPGAFLRLRVPLEQHEALMRDLRSIAGKVTSEDTTAKEVTGEYTDLQNRLTNLQRSEAQYRDLMDRSGTIDDVLNVTARLDDVRGQIEEVQGRINLLSDQSDFATVPVTLTAPPLVASSASDLPSPIRIFVHAAEASVVVAHAALNLGAVLLVAAIWLVPLGLAGLMLRRPVQRLVAASKARLS
jgi:hypothetical protein